ncbi:type II secretion system protein L [Tepidimonas alkaliphilus]|uniref:Type II secretion system protein L n=1 Tax=Tepidimonas alkaliphilus TaxID=2588942 RepID=A0A554W5K4_9BURK|nr:type II secretion system protein GspL [Tepidimonas alkaliphilus]TSE18852.1 type II secretion system protein L [Tepidimonas alkaliphilus]
MLILRPVDRCASETEPAGATPQAAPSAWHWARLDASGAVQAQGRAPADELAALGRREHVALALPVGWLAWHAVALPAQRAARTPQALAGLLEDEVLDPPDRLHWALGPAAPQGHTWVAVTREERLHATVAALQDLGWTVQRLLAESYPQPAPVLWVHALDGAPMAVLAGPHGVAAVPLTDLDALLPPGMPQDDDQAARDAWSASLTYTADPAAFDDARAARPQAPWQALPAARRWADAGRDRPDLAQFAWRRRIGGAGWQRALRAMRAVGTDPAWAPARWGVAAGVAVPLLAVPLAAWQARQAERALHAETQRIARAALPQAPVLLDPPRQLAQALARLGGPAAPGVLERWLHAWGALGGPPPQQVRLQGDRLELRWDAAPPAAQVRAAARAAGLTVTEDSGPVWRLQAEAGQ